MTNLFKKLPRIIHPRLKFCAPSWDQDCLYNKLHNSNQDTSDIRSELSNLIKNYFNFNTSKVFLFSSARSGIEFILRELYKKYKNKNKVILPSYACKALLDSITNCGLTPVYVDINNSLLPNHNQMLSLIDSTTLACFFHHFGGRNNYSENVLKKCTKNNVMVIDDHCQSFFLKKKTHQNIVTILSFGFSKTIASTAGGAVICHSNNLDFSSCYQSLPEDNLKESLLRFNLYSKKYYSLSYKIINRIRDYHIKNIPKGMYKIKKISSLDAKNIINLIPKLKNITRALKINFNLFNELIERKIGSKLYHFEGNQSYEYLPLHFKKNENRKIFEVIFGLQNIELEHLYVPLHLRYKNLGSYTNLTNTENYYKNAINFPIRYTLTLHDKKRLLNVLNSVN